MHSDIAPAKSSPTPSRSWWQILKAAASGWMENNALRLSAALAYYSVFSIAPLLVLSIGIAGWFFGADAVRGHLDDQLKGLVGGQAATAIQSMVQSTSQPSKSITATIVGVVTLLIGASGVFGQLKDALNTMWGVKASSGLGWRAFVRERLLSFGMVLVIGFLLLTSFLLTTALTAFNHWMESLIELPTWVWGGAALLLSMVVITVLFATIFKVLPDVTISWRHVWVGAFATALLFEVGKFGLAYYLGRESTASGFGAAGSVVLLLLWVYYASCILLFGAEFTQAYAVAHGAKLAPTELAEPVTAEARAQQGMEPHKSSPAIPEPPRESLPAIFPAPVAVPAGPPSRLDELSDLAREHMAAGMLGALGFGLAAGWASRLAERERIDPKDQMRVSANMLSAAALLLLTRSGRRMAGRAADFWSSVRKKVQG
jgi:membrane protein